MPGETAVGGYSTFISLDGRSFTLAEDVDLERSLGGDTNDVLMNGDGTARLKKNKARWEVGGLKVVCNDYNDDQQYIEELAARNSFFNIQFDLPSGLIYAGVGQLIGDKKYSSQNAVITLTVAGPGVLTKQ